MKPLHLGTILDIRTDKYGVQRAEVTDVKGDLYTVRFWRDRFNLDLDDGLRGRQFYRVALLDLIDPGR